MIFLAFLLPLALYLLLLGSFNRRATPVLLSGTWDFIGLLFAGSGFLLFTGPALVTSVSQRWRTFWVFGPPIGDGMAWTWYFLAACYFALVVGGSAYRFWRVRGQTAIYNIEPDQLHAALETTCEHLGLALVRSGAVYYFGDAPPGDLPRRENTAIQTGPGSIELTTVVPTTRTAAGEGVTLEVDAFPAMRHVTLNWEPPLPPLRREFEAELERVLAESPTNPGDLGGTLFLLGTMLLTLTLVGAITLIFLRLITAA